MRLCQSTGAFLGIPTGEGICLPHGRNSAKPTDKCASFNTPCLVRIGENQGTNRFFYKTSTRRRKAAMSPISSGQTEWGIGYSCQSTV